MDDIAIPILPSRSIPETVTFSRRLGFTGDAHVSDAGYAIMRRGNVEIHFFLHRDVLPQESYSGCYIRVSDVAEIHSAFAEAGLPSRGIPRLTAVEDKPWRMREFALVDADGNLVRVGQVLAG